MPEPIAENAWLSIHVFRDHDLDTLLLDCACPLAAGLASAGLARGWFFLRYWDGGVHLRVRFLSTEPGALGPMRATVRDAVETYLRRHPTSRTLTPATYAATARELARAEGLGHYATTMYPNDSLVFIPYHREHRRYGYGRSVEATERHFMDSSRIAVQVLDGHPPSTERRRIAYALILAAWFTAGPDNPTEAAHDDTEVDGDLLTAAHQLRAVAAATVDPDGADPLSQWIRSLRRLRDALTTNGDQQRLPSVLDLCAHLVCNRLGLTWRVERHVRALATRTVSAMRVSA